MNVPPKGLLVGQCWSRAWDLSSPINRVSSAACPPTAGMGQTDERLSGVCQVHSVNEACYGHP